MKILEVNLLKDKISRSLILFALPILISGIFQQLYNTVDTVIIGHYLGDRSLAAVGASMAVFQVIIGISQGFGNGLSIVTARSYGAGDENLLKRSVAGSIIIGLLVVVTLMIITRFFLYDMLELLRTPSEIVDEAYSYIYIISMFISVTFMYNLLAGLYRAVGNSFMPLIFLVIASLLNIVLDLCFVIVLDMGIQGVAIATILAQSVSVVLSFGYLLKKMPILIPKRVHFKIELNLYLDLFGQGLSMALMTSIVFLASIVMQYAINDMGYLIIAGHTTARRLNNLFLMPLGTLGAAISTFVSQNKGADQRQRILEGVSYARKLVVFWGILMTVIVYMMSSLLIRATSGSEELLVIATGQKYMLWNAPFYFVAGVLFVSRYTLQGLGEKVLPLVSSIIELVLKIIFVAVLIPKMGYLGVVISEPVIWFVMTVQLILSYRKNDYMFGKHKDAK